MRVKLGEIKEELRRRMHQPIPEQGTMAKAGCHRLFQLPRRADKQRGVGRLPPLGHRPLAALATAAQPEGPDDMGADEEVGRRLASKTPHPSSLAERSLRRQAPEVRAGCPNGARPDLCGGTPAMVFPTAIADAADRLGQAPGPPVEIDATSSQQERTEPSGPRRCKRGTKPSPQREFSAAKFSALNFR